jgi:energy-coupling factor transporter ATP-binding protein EcfA2
MTTDSDVTVGRTVLETRRALLADRTHAFNLLTSTWNTVGNLRLLSFLGAAGLAFWWAVGDQRVAGLLAIPFALAFIALVIWHRMISRRRNVAGLLVTRVQEDVWRLERNWDLLPLRHDRLEDAHHPYAADLDLFGRGSLMHLLDTTVTPKGRSTLADWLLAPASVDAIRERQSAIRELAELDDLRDRMAVETQIAGSGANDPSAFVEWAERAPWLAGNRLVRWSALVLPLLLLALLLLQLSGRISWPLWLLPMAVNLLIATALADKVQPPIQRAGSQRYALRGYAALLDLLEQGDFRSPMLIRLREEVRVDGKSPGSALNELAGITRWWMPRGSLAYLPAQAFLGWDLNYLAWLERWQVRTGPAVRGWLEAAGTLESLSALAALAADQPDWTFPVIDPGEDRFSATELGHPLLAESVRVNNDVEVGPEGTFLLITGSNMSGKSTLLRSVGINIVLAQAGGPVCADRLTLPPVTLWTSVRVQDSLREGVSFFMAELLRLKQIVDTANARLPESPPVFFILDEMLQGTNTAERQIAARRIVRHLVAGGNLGAVSTHDLTLADGPELGEIAVSIHLTESVEETLDGPAMIFDYKVRPGIARSTNALKLMDVVGFDFGDAHQQKLHIQQRTGQTSQGV